MYLLFDTETTGLPKNYKAPVTDTDNWPRMVQIAWLTFDNDGKKIDSKDYIIKPVGYTIPTEASNLHGITTERAMEEGEDLDKVLSIFAEAIAKTDYLVAHNISFDEKIVGAEFVRKKFKTKWFSKKQICTMQASTDYCELPGKYGYKWPNLMELHKKLFGHGFEEAHNAAADINATAKCFWKLKELGVISV
ncbi:MAG: 3'-5' exonuclease [Bacteroidetes bacterium]|nr:MAG: 3'-5' exonuclease [Bacteroidota bacterium]